MLSALKEFFRDIHAFFDPIYRDNLHAIRGRSDGYYGQLHKHKTPAYLKAWERGRDDRMAKAPKDVRS